MPVPPSRTQWAERQAEELLSVPFIAEFVLRSPQRIDGTQKEVADLLILHKDGNLLLSQKAQEDPLSRNQQKNELWVLKAAKNGVSQLCGALRPSTKAIWCEHPRRGRVDFPTGLPAISHGIVTVETFRPVVLEAAAADLPLTQCGTPLTYISLSDFMNLAVQLRTVPELLRYLDARRKLPDAARRLVGNEQPIFEFYLLHGTLQQCWGHEHAKAVVDAVSEPVDEILERMAEYQHFSSLLEHVGHELATRSATCLDGLSPDLLRHFDSSECRQNYLLMQEVIADLPLRERAELGRQFDKVIRHVQAQAHGYAQATARADARPDWIFVFGASKTWERASLLASVEPVMRAALAHSRKRRCMMIIDRDGEGYEVAMSCPGLELSPTEADALNGARLFGDLRVASVPLEGF
jgi:hypothetical protein